ncbi:MAG: DUF192 domain-containing protein [Candidatus Dojkabacteria bacterium]
MKTPSKLTIGSIIVGIAIALLSCFSFIKLVVLQPESLVTVNPSQVTIDTGSFLRKTNDGDRVNIKFNNQTISAVVARSNAKQETGLMSVTSLPEREGMLFVFDDLTQRTFWMKNTLISLDIIYLDEKLKVVNLYDNTAANQTSVVYPSLVPSAYVLELNGGEAKKINLQIGDTLSI